jgi:hypothetical protein
MQQRRGTSEQWTLSNPVLAAGEFGVETDTNKFKVGNGVNTWGDLEYFLDETSLAASISGYVESSTLGQPDGVATLDENGKVSIGQLPGSVYLVRNNTGSTILKGTLVAASGAEPSGRIDVAPFEVTGLQDSELRVMGIATANIASGVNGTVMSFGTLTGVDTRGTSASALAVGDEDWDAGDILYAHPTVPGKLTKVRPKHDLAIAFITTSHSTTGQLAVRIVPGNFHLEWMHDVELDSPVDGDVLQFDGTNWVNVDVVSQVTAALVDSAPEALNTLNELAAALNDDENFAATVTDLIAEKADAEHTHGIEDITDFEIDSPADSSFLKYNSTTSKWENAIIIDGGNA